MENGIVRGREASLTVSSSRDQRPVISGVHRKSIAAPIMRASERNGVRACVRAFVCSFNATLRPVPIFGRHE